LISIILYGRNDNYGYNLHKRAVISLNCMAEVLEDPDDEIIFVDYNTPDDFPTFPEAVYDNLTEKARSCVRVLRVREEIHRRYKGKTHLATIEPLARNVGLRRSNPKNRWILATNTDLIFAPTNGQSLTEIARALPDGFYGAPRIEVPETLWETLDRRDPTGCIDAVKSWGSRFHLNEFVYGHDDIHFDAPGDFQLMLRSDLFANDGFDEAMLSGWHIDYNISKRLRMIYDKVGDLSESIVGYHCDHTRQVTPMHKHGGVENSVEVFIDSLTRPDIPGQRDSWGCANDPIEEVSLKSQPGQNYIALLDTIIRQPLTAPLQVAYRAESYNKTSYAPEHLLPFLADLFSCAPRSWSIGWIGLNRRTLELFSQAWTSLGFLGEIFVHPAAAQHLDLSLWPSVRRADSVEEMDARAEAFVFDFTTLDGACLAEPEDPIHQAFFIDFGTTFRALLTQERKRMAAGDVPRRFIGLNAIHNDFERVIVADVGAARTPFSLRMRHGFVLKDPPVLPADWLPRMYIGPAGMTEGEIVRFSAKGERLVCIAQGAQAHANGKEGHIVYGPYLPVRPGLYRVTARFRDPSYDDVEDGRWIMEIASDARFFAQRDLGVSELRRGTVAMEFEVLEADVIGFQLPRLECRIWTKQKQSVSISDIQVELISK
jgi:hypothetical protein